MIAALFVERGGAYWDLEGVDPWDQQRDARLYAGPYSVVAHPPCSRWCRLAGLVEARWGHKKGDDAGCFESALRSVRAWGGVLEHPAYSDAWPEFALPRPPACGWQRGICGGWSASVEQGHYGHLGTKPTWLYAFDCDLPDLTWGKSGVGPLGVNSLRRATKVHDGMSKRQRSATPLEFRDVLIAMARSVTPPPEITKDDGR